MRPATVVAPPMQRGSLFLDGHKRHAEEQLAFHEKYHDRMARLVGGGYGGGGGVDTAATGRSGPHGTFCEQSPDYWVEYARRLEQMGVPRSGDGSLRRKTTLPMTSSPPRGSSNSPRGLPPPLTRQWGGSSAAKSPTRVPEESVLQRLDWLAQEKSEPDNSDVIDLLREVEDVLVREENRKHDELHVSASSQPTGAASSEWFGVSRVHDPGRPMGVSPAPPPFIPPTSFTTETHHTSYPHTAPPPPPATTPTAHPSFQHMTQGATSNDPPGVANWSRMSNHQQMEWYRVYYAWMMYYAQYYGAVLASQQQQQYLQPPQKSTSKDVNKQKTSLKELSRESKELAGEVKRLKKNFWTHVTPKKSLHSCPVAPRETQSRRQRHLPASYAEGGNDTLYRSDHGCSYLCADPTSPPPPQPVAAATCSKMRPCSKTPQCGEVFNGRCGSSNSVSLSDAPERCGGTVDGRQADYPWLPPRLRTSDPPHRGNGRQATERDISWLYKYEESETEEKSHTTTEEGAGSHHRGNVVKFDSQDTEEGEEAYARPRWNNTRHQTRQQEQRLSVYERNRRELEQEHPPWRF